jgi:predicted small secreted protein
MMTRRSRAQAFRSRSVMRRRGLAFLPLLAVLALPLAACTENTGRGAAAGAAGGFIYDTIFR